MKEKKCPSRARLVGGLVLTTLLTSAPLVFAEDNYWTGNGGNSYWSTPTNWSLESTPTEGQNVYISANGLYLYYDDYNETLLGKVSISGDQTYFFHSNYTITASSILLDSISSTNSYTPAYYYLNYGNLVAENVVSGEKNRGYFEQLSSTTTISDTLTLGKESSAYGTYVLGGTRTTYETDGTKVTEALPGGTLQAANVIMGDAGDGFMVQIDSTAIITDTLTLGKEDGASGSYYLGTSYGTIGGGTLQAANVIIGDAGYGDIEQVGDSTITADSLIVGDDQNSTGYYRMGQALSTRVGTETTFSGTASGGTLQATNAIIGNSGTGSIYQIDSTVKITDTLIVAKEQTGNGHYSLGQIVTKWNGTANLFAGTAGGGMLEATNVIVGDAGQGSFFQIDSAANISGTLTLGNQQRANGSYQLGKANWYWNGTESTYDETAGGGTLQAANVVVGNYGNGSFSQTVSDTIDSITTISGSLTLANQNNSSGYVCINGGVLSASDIIVGVNGRGYFNQLGGKVTADAMAISRRSEVTLSGGTMLLNDSLTNEGLLELSVSGGLTVGNVFTNSGTATLAIDLSGYTGGNFITLLNSTADLDGTLKIFSSGLIQEGIFTLLGTDDGHALESSSDLDFDLYDMSALDGYTYQFLSTATGLQLSITSETSAVPAPSSILLLSSALLMLARRRQRSIQ